MSLEHWVPLWHSKPLNHPLGQGPLGLGKQHKHADAPVVCCAVSNELSCPDPWSNVLLLATIGIWQAKCLLA